MTGRPRTSARLLAQRETRMPCLSALAQELAGAKTIETILEKSIAAIKQAFGVEAIVILRDKGGALKHQAEGGCLGVLGLRPAHTRVWNESLESFLRTMALTVSIAAARELGEG